MNGFVIETIDDFYDNPLKVRQDAIDAKYERLPSGSYLGRDTINKMIVTQELEEKILSFFKIKGHDVKIVKSRYRYATESDLYLSFVHCDTDAKGWHVIIYLTLPEHVPKNTQDGIVLYEHVVHGNKAGHRRDEAFYRSITKDTENMERWNEWHREKYGFNKAVVVDYNYFHSFMTRPGGFGNSVEDSRLLHIIEVHKV